MAHMTDKGFGTIRAFLWPVHREEHRKFIPMLLMCFLVVFNYNILRATKDALVIPASGAEAIPFIKVWAILPIAFLMTFIFTRFSNYLTRRNLFYAMMIFFIGYFVLFTVVLYPLRDSLHPTDLADRLRASLPMGCRGLIGMFENWVYTTFYVMAEMWSTMIMSVLFWGFANETTPVKDAKRFYGLFGIGANFSGVVAGLISVALSKHIFNPSLPFGQSAWDQSLTLLNAIVVISGLGCMAIFWWLNSRNLGYSAEAIAAHKEAPIKMGIRKNFSYLAKSKYLILIALIVVTYNISINLIEVVWKDQVKQLYPNPGEFNAYMGDMIFWIGVIATGVSLFVSGNVIRFFGWTASALVPPVVTLLTGVLFFICLLVSNESLLGLAALAGMTPAMLALFFGSLQNCLARGSKYTLFDATKELAFVPLSPECKLKGKAAIDGVGSRIGKSGGSLIHQCLLMFFGSISLSTPIVGCILLFVVGGWILAVRGLGKQFNQLTTEHQTITVPEEEQPALSTT